MKQPFTPLLIFFFILILPTTIATNQTHTLTITTNETTIVITDTDGNRIDLNKTPNQTTTSNFNRPDNCQNIKIDTIKCSDSITTCGQTNITLNCPEHQPDTITCPPIPDTITQLAQKCIDQMNTPPKAINPNPQPISTSSTNPFGLSNTAMIIIITAIILLLIANHKGWLTKNKQTDNRPRQPPKNADDW